MSDKQDNQLTIIIKLDEAPPNMVKNAALSAVRNLYHLIEGNATYQGQEEEFLELLDRQKEITIHKTTIT